jgi:hypothetical protein
MTANGPPRIPNPAAPPNPRRLRCRGTRRDGLPSSTGQKLIREPVGGQGSLQWTWARSRRERAMRQRAHPSTSHFRRSDCPSAKCSDRAEVGDPTLRLVRHTVSSLRQAALNGRRGRGCGTGESHRDAATSGYETEEQWSAQPRPDVDEDGGGVVRDVKEMPLDPGAHTPAR